MLLCTVAATAQQDSNAHGRRKPRGYVIAGLGSAVPFGNFASTGSSFQDAAGSRYFGANNGITAFLEAGRNIKNSNWGFAINVAYTANSAKLQEWNGYWEQYEPAGKITQTTVMLGLYHTIPLWRKKLSIDLEAFMGLSLLNTPTMYANSYKWPFTQLPTTDSLAPVSSSSISFQAAATLNYSISRHLRLFLQPEIRVAWHTMAMVTKTSSEFPVTGTGYSKGYYATYKQDEYLQTAQQAVSHFNLTAGMGFCF